MRDALRILYVLPTEVPVLSALEILIAVVILRNVSGGPAHSVTLATMPVAVVMNPSVSMLEMGFPVLDAVTTVIA